MTPPPGRLLVVDDMETNRDLLARRLRALGHEVETAVHGRAALETLAARPIDLVLLDIMMPEMDGFEVLERMRADAVLRTIPVIMISAVDEIEAVAKAIELGAADYLPKPFNAVILRARVTATLEKKRLEDAARHRTRELERELEIGREIQREFLPESLPQPAGWDIGAAFHPARQVAGDFYDAFALDDGRVAFAIGDVCDKGVGAALFMALFRSLLRSHAELHGAGTPAEPAARSIVALTNDFIARTHGRSNMFATIFFGILDPATGALAWVNGGQEPPALRRRDGSVERLAPTGPAVGAMPGMEFSAKTAVLAPGDLLLAFTDGVSEARSPSGKFYGEDRLVGLLEAVPADVGALLERIVAGVRAHEAGTEPGDDLTLLACAVAAEPPEPGTQTRRTGSPWRRRPATASSPSMFLIARSAAHRTRGILASSFRSGKAGVAAGLPISPRAAAQARRTWTCSSLTEHAAISGGTAGRGLRADRRDRVARHQTHVRVGILEGRRQLRQRRKRLRPLVAQGHGGEAAGHRRPDPTAPSRGPPRFPSGSRGSWIFAAAAQAAGPVFARTMSSTPTT